MLILELVEGATLADRIARGPLPFREVLRIGRQIVDALDAAHGPEKKGSGGERRAVAARRWDYICEAELKFRAT